eukprot:6582519-Prymnesium_polylepis.2
MRHAAQLCGRVWPPEAPRVRGPLKRVAHELVGEHGRCPRLGEHTMALVLLDQVCSADACGAGELLAHRVGSTHVLRAAARQRRRRPRTRAVLQHYGNGEALVESHGRDCCGELFPFHVRHEVTTA